MIIKKNELICIYAQNPREKFWGRLYEVNAQGVQFFGIELTSFDAWCQEIGNGDEISIFPSTLFIPTWRLEKIILDVSQGVLNSFGQKFIDRTDSTLNQHIPLFEDC